MTPIALGLLAIVLAGPAPVLLGRASWPYRVPRAAIVLWQALALSAVLAALGAGFATGLAFVVDRSAGPLAIVLHVAVLLLTAVVAVRLAWAVLLVAVELRARRKRHRALVDVLDDPRLVENAEALVPNLRVIAEERPLAYCLPALREARVIVSHGTLAQLPPAELRAVLEHELAHLRARHDLVVEAFTALRRAFPWFGRSGTALERNQVLVEMLADDAACRTVAPADLGRALVRLGTAAPAAHHGGLAAGGPSTLLRLNRLAATEPAPRGLAAATYLAAAALVLVPTFALALPWLDSLVTAVGS